jgi:hypothetical protein
VDLRSLFRRWRKPAPVPPPIEHGPSGIRAVGHREYVGGKWDEIGRLQFDFLVARGLRPQHYLLDIACGSLRGGVHFIPYLEPGHYLGIDKESDLIRAGAQHELTPELRETKRPVLIVDGEFAFERFGVAPNVALAQSLFTHLPPELIGKCFRNLGRVIADDGAFYATYFESNDDIPNPDRPHDWGRFSYTRAQMERFGADAGFRFEYIGDWNHPRGQIMTCYRPE